MELQRLLQPSKSHSESFAGAHTYQGLSKKGRIEFSKVCRLDYMDDAHYELGVIPRCLSIISQDIYEHHVREIVIEDKEFYFLLQEENLEYVNHLKQMIKLQRGLRESRILDVLKGKNEEIAGWIDIKKNVIFGVDKAIIEKIKVFLSQAREDQKRIERKKRREKKKQEKIYGTAD